MIYQGDCLELLRKIPVGKIKCIFADPFDNIGLKYNSFDDNKKDSDYYDWIRLLILETLPKCKLFWLCYNAKHYLEFTYIIRDIIKYRHPSFKVDQYIWRYTFSQYNDSDCAYGYRPLIRFKRDDAIIYPDPIREPSQRQLLGDARAAGLRVPDNVFSVPRIVGNSPERCSRIPTQIPIKLLEKVISFSINRETELFLDLFGGSGSAIKAGIQLGNSYNLNNISCCEIDESYCQAIQNEVKPIEIDIIKVADY